MLPESEAKAKFASRFNAYRAGAAQIIPNGAIARVKFDTEHFDGLAEFDNAVTYLFTPRRAGYYLLKTQICFSPVAIGDTMQIAIADTLGVVLCISAFTASAAVGHYLSTSTVRYLTPTAAIEVNVWQNTGGGLALVSSPIATFFCAHRLS